MHPASLAHNRLPHPASFQGGRVGLVPLLSGSLPALRALTNLRVACCQDVDVSGLTGLRRLEIQAQLAGNQDGIAVEGLSGLTALEDLRFEGDCEPMAQPSDLAPLTALTRLAMTCVPPELAPHPVAARLRRLELQAFGVLEAAAGGGNGSGANGAAAAALAALARGAPLLERLCIHVDACAGHDEELLLSNYPEDIELGAPLGTGVAWPSLTHLEVTPWAALLLASCAFPRLSRLVANIIEWGGDYGIASNEQLRTAVAELAAKARDHAALVVDDYRDYAPGAAASLLAAVAVPRLRHLSWNCSSSRRRGAAPAPPGDRATPAASLESLELAGPLAAFGYAEPLAALTGLTRLSLSVDFEEAPLPPAADACKGSEPPMGPAGSAPARTARALARLPRLAHLRLMFFQDNLLGETPYWDCPAVAAELARSPALRLLEIDCRDGPLWRHELGPVHGPGPRVPRPSPAWPPFAQALRAGGSGAVVRPAPERFPHDFEI
jgi:hypothetical protein